MVKVKKYSKGPESFSKALKKSNCAVQSIKSPIVRKKSIKSVSPASLKSKKSKNKNVSIPSIVNQKSSKKGLTENKQNKSEINDTQNIDFESKFKIKIEDVKNAVEGVIKLHSANPKVKNQLFEDEPFPISLMVNCHKIPSGQQKILRIPLSHSLLTPDDDVCLFVSEVHGIGNKEHEKHVEHYENLFAKKGVTNIKKIMTVHELNTEYETYEQKLRLADLYDYFLVCGKVSGKVVNKCGKIFYKKRKVPTSVRLQVQNLKEHIDKQLSKTFFHIHLKGDSYYTDFGSSKMEITKIVENFVSVVEFLANEFPGRFSNIKGLYITAPRACSIPVYMSIKNPNEIPNVKVQHKDYYKTKSAKGEITTQLDAEVIVKPSGQVTVIREKTGNNKKRPNPVTEDNCEIPLKKSKNGKNKSQISKDSTSEKKVGHKIVEKIVSEELSQRKSKTKNKTIENTIEKQATEEHSQKNKTKCKKLNDNTAEKNIHKSVEQIVSDGLPKKKSKTKIKKTENVMKSKTTNKKVEIENRNAPNKENSQRLKKHKLVEIETDEVIKKKSEKKIQRVKHLDNSITIEELSSSPIPTKKNQENVIFNIKKTVRKGRDKKIKNRL